MKQAANISANKTNEQSSSSTSSKEKQKSFFAPVVQPKLNVNQPNDSFEQEADRIANQVSTENNSAAVKNAARVSVQKAPRIIQRQENEEEKKDDTDSKVLTGGAGIVWNQLKLQPGFAEWKEQQVSQLKYKLWESQPGDYKFGMAAFGLSSIGLLGAAVGTDPGFRRDTIKTLEGVPLPLFLLPGSEYLALDTFKYTLPTAENAPYKFQTTFDLSYFTKLAREKWGGPKVGLTFGLDSSYSEQGGFNVTGGKINLLLGGGIVNLQGFINQPLPPTPTLISDPTKGEPPTWLMRSLPTHLEENLPLGTGVYLTVDVLRVPELWGGGQKETPPKREQKDTVSRKQNSSSDSISGQPAPNIVGNVLSSGNGASLDKGTQSFMEDRMGYDFSQVRIHTGHQASESARSINAKAYTSGNNIVFDQGQYQPSSQAGKNLLAHELVHVVQQSPDIQRKDAPSAQDIKDTEAAERIRLKLEAGEYGLAYLELNDHTEWEGLQARKRWLAKFPEIRKLFLKHLPPAVIAETYTASELVLKTSVTAFSIIDCWYPTEKEKEAIYLENPPLFNYINQYISPYTGEPLGDVIANLKKAISSKEYTSSFNNKEFHTIHLLAPTIESKFRFYKKYEDLFKLVAKKFDPYTGIRHSTMEMLTDTNEVDREQALRIYDQLKKLDEEQRKAFIEAALFAGTLEADKDAQAYYKKNFNAQYKVLPHNWDFALFPWNWNAPFADRLTIDHVALMSTALNYEDKVTRKFGFDRGINTQKAEGKNQSDADALIARLKDDAIFTDPGRLSLLLAIGVRGDLEKRITDEVLLPKNVAGKITAPLLTIVETYGFLASDNFKYHADKAKEAEHTKWQTPYIMGRTLFQWSSGSVIGEQRGTFDTLELQEIDTNKGALGGMRFTRQARAEENYYNNEWLDKVVREHKGSDTLLANLEETKGSDRRGKIFASIRNDINQANIYASSLSVEGLNYFGGGSLYRSGPGALQGLAIHLSWTKDTSESNNSMTLSLGIDNIQLDDFQLIGKDSTLAIGHIGMRGLNLSFSQEKLPAAEGLFWGMLKNADFTLKALLTLLPNVLKLLPYAVMTMTEEFKGARVHKYKDALGALMQADFSALNASLTFTSLSIRNMYDTTAGFLDDFTIEQRNDQGQLVRQGLTIRETISWTADAMFNMRRRITAIDNKIRAMKAELAQTDEHIQLTALEEEYRRLLNEASDKSLKHKDNSAERNRMKEILGEKRELNKALESKFKEAIKDNPLYQPENFLLLEKEKAELEKDLAYLDNQYWEDKKRVEGDSGAERYEVRKRLLEFESKYRSFDVGFSLKGITLKGGNYVKDLINESLKSMGFESPQLEGIENINIGAIQSAFVASGKGASAQVGKPGVAIRKLHIPLIKAPVLDRNTDGMRLKADSPVLENVFASVTIDFVANPLDRDPAAPYKYKLSRLYIDHAKTNGLQLFMGNDKLPLLDFPIGVPVELWGIELWDFDPEKGNINLRIRDVKAAGKYQEKNEKEKTSREIGFGIDTTIDKDPDPARKHAIDIRYNAEQKTIETKLNIDAAWISSLNIQSAGMSIVSLPDVNAVEVKDIQADIKVWLEKEYEGLDVKRDLSIDINSLKIGEISAQGITLTKSEETEVPTKDPKKKKTVKKIQEVTLPKEDKVFIRNIDVAGLRVTLTETGPLLGTTGTEDAHVKLGTTDLSGIGYKEKTAKGSILKSITVHTGRFDKLELSALGRNGREYTVTEFLKFFGRTRLEGLEAGVTYNEGVNSASVGVIGQKKKTPKGLQNVPIAIDYHEGDKAKGERDYYSMRLPLARINLPALNIVKEDHHIIIPKPTDKYSLSYLSDVDVRLRAYVDIPADGPVSYDIYLDSLDIGKIIVYGLEYHNKKLGVDVVFDKVAPISIPNVKAGGFRLSSTKGFDVFGKAGGWVDAALDPTKDIEASFASITKRLTDGEFLAESDKGRAALDINISSLGYRQDKEGNMVITLGVVQSGFPKMTIRQTDPVTKVKTETVLSSIDKALYAESIEIKLNADTSKEINTTKLMAGGLKIVSTETKGADVSTTTVNLDAGALNADSASVKINADTSKEITLKNIRGGRIKIDMVSTGTSGKSEKYINMPDPEHITVDEVKVKIDAAGLKSITLVKPTIRKFDLNIPSQTTYGDYFKVVCDLKVNGDVWLGDGNFDTMKTAPYMAAGAAADAFVANVPYFMPIEVTNIKIEHRDTEPSKPGEKKAEAGLTADQEELLRLEEEMDKARSEMISTPSHIYGHAEGMPQDNPEWEEAYDKWAAAKEAYDKQKAKMIGAAKAEAAASRTKKYLDAVEGKVWASMEIYDTKIPLTVETYKHDKYVEFSDEFVQGFKPLISSIVRSTYDAKFWSSEEMKKIGKSLQRWYVWFAPATGGIIDAIADGHAFGAVLLFLEKTTIDKGVLDDDPTMFGLKFNFDTSWATDIGSTDEFGVPLCETKYKHPEKDNFYNLYGLIEYWGYVSSALVSKTSQRDAANLKDLPAASQDKLDDKGIKEAIALLIGYIKAGMSAEAENIVKDIKKNIKRVDVSADISLTPQDIISEILKEKSLGKFEFAKKKDITNIHIEGLYENKGSPQASGKIGGGPAGIGNITIPGATYTSQDAKSKVTYDSVIIKPVTVDYKNSTLTLAGDSIQIVDLKAAIKK